MFEAIMAASSEKSLSSEKPGTQVDSGMFEFAS